MAWLTGLVLGLSGGLPSPSLAAASHSQAVTVQFVNPTESPYLTEEGKVQLQWEPAAPGSGVLDFQLERSRSEDFDEAVTMYRGRDLATYVSGLPAGDFYYRVRVASGPEAGEAYGPWSETMVVEVRYQSWNLVLTLMITGTVVLAATVGVICKGHLEMARKDAVEP